MGNGIPESYDPNYFARKGKTASTWPYHYHFYVQSKHKDANKGNELQIFSLNYIPIIEVFAPNCKMNVYKQK